MKVADAPCSQCPFKGRASLRQGRVKAILKGLEDKDNHFVCHKSLSAFPERLETDVTCRGYWDLMEEGKAHEGQLVRIAKRLAVVTFVKVEA